MQMIAKQREKETGKCLEKFRMSAERQCEAQFFPQTSRGEEEEGEEEPKMRTT